MSLSEQGCPSLESECNEDTRAAPAAVEKSEEKKIREDGGDGLPVNHAASITNPSRTRQHQIFEQAH